MPQSLCQLYTHIVFSTKNRHPFLRDVTHQQAVHGYLKGTCDNQNCPAIKIGGVADHVHILCRMSSGVAPKNLLAELKRDSSKHIKTLSLELKGFYWQSGYGAFSVSPSHVPSLTAYIENQAEHHRQESFQDEFRRFDEKI